MKIESLLKCSDLMCDFCAGPVTIRYSFLSFGNNVNCVSKLTVPLKMSSHCDFTRF